MVLQLHVGVLGIPGGRGSVCREEGEASKDPSSPTPALARGAGLLSVGWPFCLFPAWEP